ncbi:MAG: FtsX-like permease family protein [Anaerolineae bacterium]|nr:FtsX-like permease family protein [Anaerolineae bacterium]
MVRTRWQKVFIDLWRNRGRTLVVALAIAVGVFAVGGVLNTQELMLREFERGQSEARLADAVVYTIPFTESFAERVTRFPEVSVAEGRHVASGRTPISEGEWQNVVTISVPDFEAMEVDAVLPLQGSFPPGDREIVLEHLSLDYLGMAVGERLDLEMDNGARKQLRIAGTVHDPQQMTPEIMGDVVGYVTPETMTLLGETGQFTELRIRVADHAEDRRHVEAVVAQVEDQIEASGRPVLGSRIPERFIRPIIDTLLVIISTFGGMILFLSGFLVVNVISALITQQIKQIGVMKLIGARRSQVISLYLLTVLVYGAIAVAIGLPLSVVASRFFMKTSIEGLLNIVSESYSLPPLLIAAQVAIGLLLPLAAGLLPAWRGTRITTFEALNDAGVAKRSPSQGAIEPLLARLQGAGLVRRPLVLALRNTLRHKGRLAQTLFVLIFGTALFIAVLTVRSSVNETIDGFLRFHQYDVSVELDGHYRQPALEQVALGVPDVAAVETWSTGAGTRLRADGSKSSPFMVNALPPDTALMSPRIDGGRWLEPEDGRAVVVNSDVTKDEPDLHVGSEIVLDLNGREAAWQVVGIVSTVARGPAIYVPLATYAHLTGTPGQATQVKVVTAEHDAAAQEQVKEALFTAFEQAGIGVSRTETTQEIRGQNELMFNLIVIFLIIMALLLAAVGGLGLTTTMSINVLERIREIGVLRAIGAANPAVRKIVVAEGVLIGVLSWVIGFLISFPVGAKMSEVIGMALLNIPLTYRYSALAAAVWFVAIVLIAVAASLGPARNAVKLTVREVLAYE